MTDTDGSGNVSTGESQPFRGETVDVGSFGMGMAGKSVIGPRMIIGDDQHDVGLLGIGLSGGPKTNAALRINLRMVMRSNFIGWLFIQPQNKRLRVTQGAGVGVVELKDHLRVRESKPTFAVALDGVVEDVVHVHHAVVREGAVGA